MFPTKPALCAAILLGLLAPARADGPGPVSEPEAGRAFFPGSRPGYEAARPRPARRVTGGPDYVGSDWGLGKPAFYGLGGRPDWGRGSID